MSEQSTSPEILEGVKGTSYLGALCVFYSRVELQPLQDDGRRETDVEHSYMLGMVAPYLAENFYP